jgi:hypothetical protein
MLLQTAAKVEGKHDGFRTLSDDAALLLSQPDLYLLNLVPQAFPATGAIPGPS